MNDMPAASSQDSVRLCGPRSAGQIGGAFVQSVLGSFRPWLLLDGIAAGVRVEPVLSSGQGQPMKEATEAWMKYTTCVCAPVVLC